MAVLSGSCSHKLAPEGNYQPAPVVADGRIDDWKLPLRFTNEANTLQYAITNDNKNLYIVVVSKDPATSQRILRAGMNVYLDPVGGKKKEISLEFPMRKPPEPIRYRHNENNNEGADHAGTQAQAGTDSLGSGAYTSGAPIDGPSSAIGKRARLEKLVGESANYYATGFVNIQNGQYAVSDPKSPIRVAIAPNNENGVIYEAIIPLRLISNSLPSRDYSKNVSVGIVLNASSGGGRQDGDRPRGGGNGGGFRPSIGIGMGGMGMGGMGMGVGTGMRLGGGGRRNYGSGGEGQKEEDNWYTFQLAKGK